MIALLLLIYPSLFVGIVAVPFGIIGNQMYNEKIAIPKFKVALEKLQGVERVISIDYQGDDGYISMALKLKNGNEITFIDVKDSDFIEGKNMRFRINGKKNPNSGYSFKPLVAGDTISNKHLLPFQLHNYQEIINRYDYIMKEVGRPESNDGTALIPSDISNYYTY